MIQVLKKGESTSESPNRKDGAEPFKIYSSRIQNKGKLPGDSMLYDLKPPRVDYYDVFYFETRMRDMLEEYMGPMLNTMKSDKAKAIQLRFDYDTILDRLHELESFALIQDWRISPESAWTQIKRQLIDEVRKEVRIGNNIA